MASVVNRAGLACHNPEPNLVYTSVVAECHPRKYGFDGASAITSSLFNAPLMRRKS